MDQVDAVLRGNSLGLFTTDSKIRQALHSLIRHPLVELFLLILILLNLLALAATSPGSEIEIEDVSAFDSNVTVFNLFCAAVFTVEAGVRIVVQGFVRGKGTYLRSPWNVFDFVLILAIWLSFGSSSLFGSDDAGFALSVLRTLRLMRFFAGIRELMGAIALGYQTLLTVLALLCYAYIIAAVAGMALFGGVVSRQCLDPADPIANGLTMVDCPRMLHCSQEQYCFALQNPGATFDRNSHVDKLGFDTFGLALLTEFSITVLDDWGELAQPFQDSAASTRGLAHPLFAVVVLCISLLIVQLFLASITFSFLSIRRSSRKQEHDKALERSPEDTVAKANEIPAGLHPSSDHTHFPMHPRWTPRCAAIMSDSRFDAFILNTVILNTLVMAINHYDMNSALELFTNACELVFIVVYTAEAAVKIGAVGFVPYWKLKMNKLDFFIVVTSYVGIILHASATKEQARTVLAFRLLRVLRIAKLLLRVKYLRGLLELAFSTSKTVFSLVLFLMFVIVLGSIIGMHLFASECRSITTLPSTSFGSFTDSMLALFQLITGDNFGGICYYLIDCYGNSTVVATFMVALYMVCQYVTINLFVAVFIENFELSEEIKARRQEDEYNRLLTCTEETDNDEETAKLVQLKALQLSLYLDKGVNQHIFMRLSKVSKFAIQAVKFTPSTVHKKAVAVVSELKNVDSSMAHFLTPEITRQQEEVDIARRRVDQATQLHKELLERWSISSAGNSALTLEVERAADDRAVAEDDLTQAEQKLLDVVDGQPGKLSILRLRAAVANAAGTALKNFEDAVDQAQTAVHGAVEKAEKVAEHAVEAAKRNLEEASDFINVVDGSDATATAAKIQQLEEKLIDDSRAAQFACFRVDDLSLAYFAPEHRLRVNCHQVLDLDTDLKLFRLTFDKVMLFFVIVSSLVLALEGPPGFQHDVHLLSVILATLDWLCFSAFALEFGIKVIAYGLIFTPLSYLSSKWHWLDLAVVACSVVDIASQIAGAESSIASTFRLLRILRPLKLLRLVDGMHVVLDAVQSAAPAMLGIGLCILLTFTAFGILGVAFFAGRLYRCSEDVTLNRQQCSNSGMHWENPDFSFDDIFSAFGSLFFVWTADDWGRVLHACMNAPEQVNAAPTPGASKGITVVLCKLPFLALASSLHRWLITPALFFAVFVTFIVVAVFMLKGLFIACLVDLFAQSSGSATATLSQKNWMILQLLLNSAYNPTKTAATRCCCFSKTIRRSLRNLFNATACEYLINSSVVVTVAVMLLPTELWPNSVAKYFELIEALVLLLWIFEFFGKAVAWSPQSYFLREKIDCVVIPILIFPQIHSAIDVYLPSVAPKIAFLDFIAGLQFLRVLRLTRLLQRSRLLAAMFSTIRISLPQVKNILIVILLLIFIYGVLGMKVYGNVCATASRAQRCEALGHRATFQTTHSSMVLLFQIMTGEDTSRIMRDIMNECGSDCSTSFLWFYVVSYHILTNIIFLNLFVAVLLENYELGVAADNFDITKDDVESLKLQWDECGHSMQIGIHVQDLHDFVCQLHGRFAQVRIDRAWYNRLLIELQEETKQELDADLGRIHFAQLALALCLLLFGTSCLGAEERLIYENRVDNHRKAYAVKLLTAAVRCNVHVRRFLKQSSNGYLQSTELGPCSMSQWSCAARVCRTLLMHVIIERYKVTKPKFFGGHYEGDHVLNQRPSSTLRSAAHLLKSESKLQLSEAFSLDRGLGASDQQVVSPFALNVETAASKKPVFEEEHRGQQQRGGKLLGITDHQSRIATHTVFDIESSGTKMRAFEEEHPNKKHQVQNYGRGKLPTKASQRDDLEFANPVAFDGGTQT
eukprot:SAG31_NODE_1633_length_7689_cov_3.155599_2_plen_1828_part_00